jgi:hypothetical protein
VDFSLAQFVQVIVLLSTGGANGGGYMASKYVVLAIYCAILILHGLINSLSIQWLAWFGQFGAFWNLAGTWKWILFYFLLFHLRALCICLALYKCDYDRSTVIIGGTNDGFKLIGDMIMM